MDSAVELNWLSRAGSASRRIRLYPSDRESLRSFDVLPAIARVMVLGGANALNDSLHHQSVLDMILDMTDTSSPPNCQGSVVL